MEGTSELAVSQDGYSRCARVKPLVGVWLQRAGLSRYRTGLHSLEVTARRGGGFTAPEANKAAGGAGAGPAGVMTPGWADPEGLSAPSGGGVPVLVLGGTWIRNMETQHNMEGSTRQPGPLGSS